MPIVASRGHRPILQVHIGGHYDKAAGRDFHSTYLSEDAYGMKYFYPGMIVAEASIGGVTKYVPYHATDGTYGVGCGTPVGIETEFHDMTMGDKMIAPMWHAHIIEDHAYVWGGALGTVPAAVKTALAQIEWD